MMGRVALARSTFMTGVIGMVQDKIADAESKLQDLQRAVSRSLGEQGSLVMEHTGLEKQIAMMQQQDALTKVRCLLLA